MKTSSNTIGLLIFVIIATTAFVYMAKRPPIEGKAINFGMPIKSTDSTTKEAKESNTESQTDANLPETETQDITPAETTETTETTEPDSQAKSPTESPPVTEPAATN